MHVSEPHAKPLQPNFINRRLKPLKAIQWERLYHLQISKCLVTQGCLSQEGGLGVLKGCGYGDPSLIWIYNEEHGLVLNNLPCLDMSETRSSRGSWSVTGQEEPSHWLWEGWLAVPSISWTVPESGWSTESQILCCYVSLCWHLLTMVAFGGLGHGGWNGDSSHMSSLDRGAWEV